MATIIHDDDDKYSFNRHAYVNEHWQDREFIDNVNRRASEFESSLNVRARTHYDNLSIDRKLDFDADEFVRQSKKALSLSKKDLSRYEGIFDLDTLENIQRPPIRMQSYIISEPRLNREFRNNRLQGYELDVRDYNPLWLAEDDGTYDSIHDPIFKQVMLGKHVSLPSGSYNIVMHQLLSSDKDHLCYKQLTASERETIRRVWTTALSYHDAGEDVTSPSGGKRYNF